MWAVFLKCSQGQLEEAPAFPLPLQSLGFLWHRGLQTEGSNFAGQSPARLPRSFRALTCCSDRPAARPISVFIRGFYSILCTIYFLTRCAQSFTVTPKDAAMQPNIIRGQKNADSLSKNKGRRTLWRAGGRAPGCWDASCWEEVCHRRHLFFLGNAQVALALGYRSGVLLAVDACSATALQQPQLIHRFKLGMKTSAQPTNTENLHDESLCVGFGSLVFFICWDSSWTLTDVYWKWKYD